jgi:hypothetical protein
MPGKGAHAHSRQAALSDRPPRGAAVVEYAVPFPAFANAYAWLEREEEIYPEARLRVERRGREFVVIGWRPAEDGEAASEAAG